MTPPEPDRADGARARARAAQPPGSQASLRAANERRLVRALRCAGRLTQAEIARRTGLSPATVSNIVHDLSAKGLLRVTPTSRGGRRARAVSLSHQAGLAVGVDFGHQHLRVAVADFAHTVLAERNVDLARGHTAQIGLDKATRLIHELLSTLNADGSTVVGVGLGVPGPIDTRTGQVGSSSILPGWVGVRPVDMMSHRLHLPVHVDNDANLGALAETTWGAARGCQDAAYIKISTGVGAGLIIGGRLYRGAGGTAGEIGHTTTDENGRVCRCGNRGCLETTASVPVVVDLLRHSHGRELTAADIVSLARDGDIGCRRVIEDVGRHVGVAVANLCNLLNPEIVVIGGELSTAEDLLLRPLADVVRRHAISSAAAAAAIVPAALGARAQVLGAVALALAEAEPVMEQAGALRVAGADAGPDAAATAAAEMITEP